MTPHSRIWIDPVSSPAPFSTATPAKTGSSQASLPARGTTTVTPVLSGVVRGVSDDDARRRR